MRTVSARRKVPPGYDDDAERRRISCEVCAFFTSPTLVLIFVRLPKIISTLVAAGVSRDVIEYAISVTDCSLDIAEIETEIMLGEAIKAQSEIVDAQDAVEDTHAKLERTHTNLIRELERKKERLDRANAYYREWLQVADLKLELVRNPPSRLGM